ncbi:MAG TPA: hypothetical protein PK036_00960 [Geobacteraceae bacterium]|nr:hypothetical protein [Geobacteraceae bacterium]
MNGSHDISSDRYDVIVIGSGMGGLTAAGNGGFGVVNLVVCTMPATAGGVVVVD